MPASVGGPWQPLERLRRWTQRPRTWVFECKLCRARFTYRSYCWPCCAKTPPHDTFHEVTARRIYCIGSLCIGRVLGPSTTEPVGRVRDLDLRRSGTPSERSGAREDGMSERPPRRIEAEERRVVPGVEHPDLAPDDDLGLALGGLLILVRLRQLVLERRGFRLRRGNVGLRRGETTT